MTRNPKNGIIEQRLVSALGAIFLLCASVPSVAQDVIAPMRVCSGERFDVEWIGPDGSGDTITVAEQQADPDDFFDSDPTADGNPATLHAPFEPGIYDIRYVQGGQNILVEDEIEVEHCLTPGGDEEDYPAVALRVHGTQIDYGDQINRSQDTPFGPAGFTMDQLCAASDAYGMALQMMADHVDAEMLNAGSPVTFDALEYVPGAPTRASIERDMRNLQDAVCDNPPANVTVQPFVVTYAYCRMAMYTPTHAMDIHLPPGTGDGTMSAADHVKREVMKMTLQRSINAVQTHIGKGWDEGLTLSAPRPATPRIGYPTSEYSFEYTAGLGGGDSPLGGIAKMVSATNKGTVWSSSRVPGAEIVQLFYERLTTELQPEGGSMSFFGGLINNLVGMLRAGLPLEIDQTTSSKVMGVTQVSGRSRSIISSVEMVSFDRQWCNESLMPAAYTVNDIDAQLAEAMGGTNSAEMSAAMQEYNTAMEQMTPEQRAMMENMGMGDMMGKMMGGAAAAGGQPSAGSTSPPNAACSSPSSKDLSTDDMLQTVQKHLHALGYDPGNTDGDESFMTTIAISQFQAEKGIEATGEVTPQLLGILAAEVDGRC